MILEFGQYFGGCLIANLEFKQIYEPLGVFLGDWYYRLTSFTRVWYFSSHFWCSCRKPQWTNVKLEPDKPEVLFWNEFTVAFHLQLIPIFNITSEVASIRDLQTVTKFLPPTLLSWRKYQNLILPQRCEGLQWMAKHRCWPPRITDVGIAINICGLFRFMKEMSTFSHTSSMDVYTMRLYMWSKRQWKDSTTNLQGQTSFDDMPKICRPLSKTMAIDQSKTTNKMKIFALPIWCCSFCRFEISRNCSAVCVRVRLLAACTWTCVNRAVFKFHQKSHDSQQSE